jgi:hypothetical protein
MPNMMLAVPEDLFEVAKKHPEIKWSVIAREAMWEYARRVELMEKLAAKSMLNEADVESIGRKVKRATAKRYSGDP